MVQRSICGTKGLGMLTVRSGENTVATVPLLAAEDVARPGYFGILGRLAGSMLGL